MPEPTTRRPSCAPDHPLHDTGDLALALGGDATSFAGPREHAGDPAVMSEVAAELARAEATFPDQHLPDGTADGNRTHADWARGICQQRAATGELTWLDVLREEFYEAAAETDPDRLRAELVQVIAVAARWIGDIDRRTATETGAST